MDGLNARPFQFLVCVKIILKDTNPMKIFVYKFVFIILQSRNAG